MARCKRGILQDLLAAKGGNLATAAATVHALHSLDGNGNNEAASRREKSPRSFSLAGKFRTSFLVFPRSFNILHQIEKETCDRWAVKLSHRFLNGAMQDVFEDYPARKKKSGLIRLHFAELTS